MLYTHRWPITISSLIIFLIIDSCYYLYPLYLTVVAKERLAQQLTIQYQIKRTQLLPKKTTAIPAENDFLIPYQHTVWLSELTRRISASSITIKKIEKITANDMSNTTRWTVNLSGNAYTLHRFFYLFYRDFPWLAIADPHFTLNNNEVSVSFQLIALSDRPAHRHPFIPEIQTKKSLFPFCQSLRKYSMQHDTFKQDHIAGIIQYGQTKTTLTRIENEHVALSIQAQKT